MFCTHQRPMRGVDVGGNGGKKARQVWARDADDGGTLCGIVWSRPVAKQNINNHQLRLDSNLAQFTTQFILQISQISARLCRLISDPCNLFRTSFSHFSSALETQLFIYEKHDLKQKKKSNEERAKCDSRQGKQERNGWRKSRANNKGALLKWKHKERMRTYESQMRLHVCKVR